MVKKKIPVTDTFRFIRYCIKENGEANPYETYKRLKSFRSIIVTQKGKPYSSPSSISMNRYFYVLKSLRLIEQTRIGTKGPIGEHKKYYSFVQENLRNPAWRNPQKAFREMRKHGI